MENLFGEESEEETQPLHSEETHPHSEETHPHSEETQQESEKESLKHFESESEQDLFGDSYRFD